MYVYVVYLLIKRKRHDHFNTIRSHRYSIWLTPTSLHLGRFFRLFLSLVSLYGWEHKRIRIRRKKEIERNINYWIRIVYYFNNSTWFVVYICVRLLERCESVLFYPDFLFLHTHIIESFSFYLNNSSRVRYAKTHKKKKKTSAFVSRTQQRKNEREEFFPFILHQYAAI